MTHDTTPFVREGASSTHNQHPEERDSIQGPTDTNGVHHSRGLPETATNEYPVADFIEPVTFGWTEAGFEVRQAIKKFSEETHADY